MPARERSTLDKLRVFARAFFQLPVEVERPRPLPTRGMRFHGDPRPIRQYHTESALTALAERRRSDALVSLGVTFEDLYPERGWNFVFGEADLERRVAVYSPSRFEPQFDDKPHNLAARRQALRRSVQLLAHETSHVFGLVHCTKNECVMNGSNSLDESDRAPVHLCPICLRKLAHAVGFDVVARYRELYAFYAAHGLTDEARWLRTRLARFGASTEERR